MYKFNVSAPGRVFLNGEPMRYEEISIATSLSLRTTLTFTSLSTSAFRTNFIEINFSSIMLHIKIPLKTYLVYFTGKNVKRTDVQFRQKIKKFVSLLQEYTGTYESSNHAHQLSLQAFFFLLVLISNERNIDIQTSFIVKISTELPIGEGLGSSASFTVCLAACFYRWSLLQKGLVFYEFNDEHLIDIVKYAKKCESLIYNSSTLIDTIVSVYGSIHVFDKEFAMFTRIPSMKILLVFSNASQKTITEQNKQMEKMKQYPFVKCIQNSIKATIKMSTEIFGLIESIWNLNESDIIHTSSKYPFYLSCCERLSTLIHVNQGLLRALGMSHPNLDNICAIARDFALGGKITNNGGGGYAFILLLPSSTDKFIQDLINIFESHNFPAKIASLNCSGLRIE